MDIQNGKNKGEKVMDTWDDVGHDEDDNAIDIVVEYEADYHPAEKDVGIMSGGYGVNIWGATVEKTGKPYDYGSTEEDKWCEKISENLGGYRDEY